MNATIFLASILLAVEPLALPRTEGSIGFDDLRYSPELRKLLVPGGRSGRLYLVDPESKAVEAISGFSSSAEAARGHSEGTTSAESGDGLIFASDRSQRELVVVDPGAKRIVARSKLGAVPDYVRWVAPLKEVWVTEPGAKIIETFRLEGKAPPKLVHAGKIDEVRNYCLCDVVQTAGIFLRVQLLRGEFDLDSYRQAMGGLIETIRMDARVAPVSKSLNEARLLIDDG